MTKGVCHGYTALRTTNYSSTFMGRFFPTRNTVGRGGWAWVLFLIPVLSRECMRKGKSGNCHGLSPHNDVDDSSNVILSDTKDLGDSMTVITRLEIHRYAQNDAEVGDYGVRVYFYIPVLWWGV